MHFTSGLPLILTVAGGLGLSVPYFNRQRNKAILDVVKTQLQVTQDERDEYKQVLADRDQRHEAEKKESDKKIAQLESRIDFLSDRFADLIAEKVADRVVKVVNG